MEYKTVTEYQQELSDFLTENTKKLVAICKEQNVEITPYTLPDEEKMRADFEKIVPLLALEPEVIENNLDVDDPILREAFYMGFRSGTIMDDFTEYAKHAISEIKAYRKKHKHGFHKFDFARIYRPRNA